MTPRKEPNFIYLQIGILIFLICGPTLESMLGNRLDGIVLMSVYTTMIVISLWSLQETRWVFLSSVGLAILSVGFIVIDVLMVSIDLTIVSLGIYFLFQLLTIWLASNYLFSEGHVTLNKIVGGTCIYFLIGMSWAIFYVVAMAFDPNAFTGPSLIDQGQVYWDMTYFSFVTLTTLGYGDIMPVRPIAKALAYTEAVVGQIYVAVLIGALVATYTGSRLNKKHSANRTP